MLSLALLRHAKSSWEDSSLSDFDRPLNARGQSAAPLMGRKLAELDIIPELILCSTSKRTRQTLESAMIAAEEINGARASVGDKKAPRIVFEDDLYLASSMDLFRRLRAIPSGPETVLLVGHNPGLQDLAAMLAGKGDAKSLSRLLEKYPTAGLAIIHFEASTWRDIAPGDGRLEAFITPKDRA